MRTSSLILFLFLFCFTTSLSFAEKITVETLKQKWEAAKTANSQNPEKDVLAWYKTQKKQWLALEDNETNRTALKKIGFSDAFIAEIFQKEKALTANQQLKKLTAQNEALQKQLAALQKQLHALEQEKGQKNNSKTQLGKTFRFDINGKDIDFNNQIKEQLQRAIKEHKNFDVQIEAFGDDKDFKFEGNIPEIMEGKIKKIIRKRFNDAKGDDKNVEIFVEAFGEDGKALNEKLNKKIRKLLKEKLKNGNQDIDIQVEVLDDKEPTIFLKQKKLDKHIKKFFKKKTGKCGNDVDVDLDVKLLLPEDLKNHKNIKSLLKKALKNKKNVETEVKGKMIIIDDEGNKKVYNFPNKKFGKKIKGWKKGSGKGQYFLWSDDKNATFDFFASPKHLDHFIWSGKSFPSAEFIIPPEYHNYSKPSKGLKTRKFIQPSKNKKFKKRIFRFIPEEFEEDDYYFDEDECECDCEECEEEEEDYDDGYYF